MITMITFMCCFPFPKGLVAYRLDRGRDWTTALRLPKEFPQSIPDERKDDENHQDDHPVSDNKGNPGSDVHSCFSFCSLHYCPSLAP